MSNEENVVIAGSSPARRTISQTRKTTQPDMSHRSYLLEMTSRSDFRPKAFSEPDIVVVRADAGDVSLCIRLWADVGRGFWSEREDWAPERWHARLSEPGVSFRIARKQEEAVGFFELMRHEDDMKIEGFGLLPQWRNRGLGGALLSAATQQAFDSGARRIWLHTATDDHPNALPNYTNRGYRIYREEALANPMPGAIPNA
jgi:ribosomal protein S18 acetylase RimI-like enzyme